MGIVRDLAEALQMVKELPFLMALPIYGIAYGAAVFVIAKAVKADRDAMK